MFFGRKYGATVYAFAPPPNVVSPFLQTGVYDLRWRTAINAYHVYILTLRL